MDIQITVTRLINGGGKLIRRVLIGSNNPTTGADCGSSDRRALELSFSFTWIFIHQRRLQFPTTTNKIVASYGSGHGHDEE
ncbi:hypothetical protein ACFX2A_045257 [Malus domestica]